MKRYKICPVCNTKNEDSEVLCGSCFADISNAAIKIENSEIQQKLNPDFQPDSGNQNKICPACGAVNPDYAMLCDSCQIDITEVKPGNCNLNAENASLILYSNPSQSCAKIKIAIKNGDVVGRCGKCANPQAEYLKCLNISDKEDNNFIDCMKFNTVSRRHAQFIYENGTFFIIALPESKNATCLNGEVLERGRRYSVKSGDIIKFSSKLELSVK